MENKTNITGSLQKDIVDTAQKITQTSIELARPLINGLLDNALVMQKSILEKGIPRINLSKFRLQKDDCCPPKATCQPHCLTHITRHAVANERIIVPFIVKNTCNVSKTFSVGVRELKNVDGTTAPSRPLLDKKELYLEAGRSERVLMTIDLTDFSNGSVYNTEIVIREKDINQNICFTLFIDAFYNVPVAVPLEEYKYRMHFQSWQSHFYCEPKEKG